MSDKVALVRLRANNSQYDKAMRDSAKITEQLQGALGKIDASKLDKVGSDLTRNVTLPLAALGGFATKAANDYDAAFTQMMTLGGATAAEIDGLKESVEALAVETGRGPQELAQGLLNIRSAGFEGAQALDVLEASAKGAAIGLGTTDEIANAVTSVILAYGEANITAAQAVDVLVAAAQASKIEAAQLAPQLGRLLPIAAELGISFDQVAGATAAFGGLSGDASLAATQLGGAMQKILKPSEIGAKALESVGLSLEMVQDKVRKDGLLATLEMLRERLGDTGFNQFFDDIQGLQGALIAVGANQEQVAAILDDVANAAGRADTAFETWAKSMGAQNAKAFAELQVALIQLGEQVAPLAADLLQFAAAVASEFALLPEPIQKGILAITGMTAVMGPFLKAGAAGVQVAQGMVTAWDSKRLESFRLGLMGVTEAGAGAGNKLGALMGTLARSPVAWGLGAAGVVGLTYAFMQMRDESRAAEKAAKDLAAAAAGVGRSVEAEFRDRLGTAFAPAYADVDNPFEGVIKNIGFFQSELSDLMGQIDGLDKAGLADALLGTEAQWEAALAKLREAAAASSNPGAANAMVDDLEQLRGAATQAQVTEKAVADTRLEVAGATDEMTASTEAATTATNEVTSALEAQRSAAEAVTSAQASAASARKAVVDAERGVAQARKGVEQATRGVTDAERGLADAQRAASDASAELADALREQQWGSKALEDANRGVVDAEKALAAAQRESKDAQDALNDARATAAERLRDLEQAVGDSALDEEGARIALARAQERKANLGADGEDVSALDRREAALAVAEAEARLREVLERNAEMEAELAEAREKGVEGSDEVAAAQERITESAEAEKEAQENLTEAQERVAEVHEEMAARVDAAQRQVEEANQRVHDAAMRVRDAVDQVGEAQQRVVDATGAVVEARGRVEQAERDVEQAMLDEAIAALELEDQIKNNSGAIRDQIGRYDELAARLDPGSPLRDRINQMRADLLALAGEYNVMVSLQISSGLAQAGDAVAQGILDALDATRRAGGGTVHAGESYWVGDRTGMANAELFTPGQSGTLTPAADMHMTASSGVGGGEIAAALGSMADRLHAVETGVTMGDVVTHVHGVDNIDRIGVRISEKIGARLLAASP